MQTVTVYLLYEDVAAAIDWLGQAFGFQEKLRYADDDGTVTHAEMTLGDGEIFLGHPGVDYQSPRRLGAFTHITHVYVDDVDAHHARAVEAGATITTELHDTPYGDRRYDTVDPEGQHWSFARLLREVEPEDWGATRASGT